MNIVTTGDSTFFHCLVPLAQSVRKFYNKRIIIYDIGLAAEQKSLLDARIIPISVGVDFYNYSSFKKTPFIRATHKPFCVKRYFEDFSEPMILVDADCLFTERVEENGFDLGVTLKPKNKIELSNHYNGVLNSGVVFFNGSCSELVDRWMDECKKPDTTDQKALTDILSETIDFGEYDRIYDWYGLKIKVFSTDKYNDYYFRKGRIFHFKGKRHDPDIYKKLLDALDTNKDMYGLYKRLLKKDKMSVVSNLTRHLIR